MNDLSLYKERQIDLATQSRFIVAGVAKINIQDRFNLIYLEWPTMWTLLPYIVILLTILIIFHNLGQCSMLSILINTGEKTKNEKRWTQGTTCHCPPRAFVSFRSRLRALSFLFSSIPCPYLKNVKDASENYIKRNVGNRFGAVLSCSTWFAVTLAFLI